MLISWSAALAETLQPPAVRQQLSQPRIRAHSYIRPVLQMKRIVFAASTDAEFLADKNAKVGLLLQPSNVCILRKNFPKFGSAEKTVAHAGTVQKPALSILSLRSED